ncbi:MAG TPA: adenylate/guanylate cyclase domain-containing protein [Acidimicrobiia bacterium]|nr:adenylate/guanylate cyclase domain-containing protein [Acidimicrobiia bacterium]
MSALFVDLVGFTPLTEARDSEEVRHMLTVYFDRAREVVDRFGGVIEKYIGDAVMAVWGAQTAHEDDAERAVRAALELIDAVQAVGEQLDLPDLRARAGVVSGEAVVGGDGNATTGLIVGDTINTASRIQSSAAAGEVLVGRSTRDLASRSIDFESVGSLELKGKEVPVEAFKAVRVVAGIGGTRRMAGLVPPFVGRTDELRLLKDNLHAVQRDRRLRLVSIVGQGGIGKSRLLDELWSYVDGLTDDVYWHHGRSLPFGENAGFWAIGEMVRQRCGITEGDDEHKTRTRLRTALAELVPDGDDRAWMEPKLENLLGISEAVAERAELFAAWRMLFTNIAVLGPVVMAFEDLHLADDGMLDFIEDLADIAGEEPILVISLARPSLLERRVGWGSGRASSVSLHLAPLAPPTIEELLRGVVPDAPASLVDQLVDRSGGIPLYAVEMIRMLIARELIRPLDDLRYEMVGEVGDVEIPDSLHGLVGARLDQFGSSARALIADAAILGQSFRAAALASLRDEPEEALQERLAELVRKEILSLNRDPRSPEQGQYQFVQSIIREVAHDRVSRADRVRLHQQVAAFYESRNEPELTGIIASHYLDALEAAGDGPDAEELLSRVIASLLNAADRADLLGSYGQVVNLCLRGVDLAGDPASRGELLTRAARAAHSALDERARDLAQRAVTEFDTAGSPLGRVKAAAVYAKLLDDVGESNDAWPALLEALEADPGETPDHVVAMAELARAFMLDGQPQGMEWTERALALAEELDMVPTIAELWATKGAGLGTSGRLREARVILMAALDLSREHQLSATKRRVTANINYISGSALDPFVEERIEDARRIGDQRLLLEALIDKAGRWHVTLDMDEHFETMAEVMALPMDAAMADQVEELRSGVSLLRGEVESAIASDEERWERHGTGDQQIQSNREVSRAVHAFYRGDPASGVELALGSNHRSPIGHQYNWATIFALRMMDAEKLQLVRGAEADLPRLPVANLREHCLEGALAALAGDIAEAEARFEAAIEIGDGIWGPIYGGMVRASTPLYLGGDHPRAREWAGVVRANWEKAGLRTLLDLYAEPFALLETAAADTA